MKILVFGSANIDYSLSVEHIVRPGETLSCGKLKKSAGGKGANQAYAIGRAGARPFFAGKVGADGAFILDRLNSAGVNTELVCSAPGGTGCAFIQVDPNGQNSIVVYGGGNQEITEPEAAAVLAQFDAGDALVLNGETGQLKYIYDTACARGMKVYLNPSPINDAVKSLDLRKASVLFFNEIEGAFFSGKALPSGEMLEALKARYPDTGIVLTTGAEGARYGFGSKTVTRAAEKVKAVDTTGAGDTFMGFFIAGQCAGKSPGECMEMATRAAALTVSRPGAMDSIPSIEELGVFSGEGC